MPKEKMGPEQLKAAKEKINKDGMQLEEGEEGGAAVYVGTKEEVTKARQLAETEGRAPDLESYLLLNKQTLASEGELMSAGLDISRLNTFGSLPKGTMLLQSDGFCWKLYFKDSAANLAKVIIWTYKIADFPKPAEEGTSLNDRTAFIKDTLQKKLKGLGFSENSWFNDGDYGIAHTFNPVLAEKYIAEHRQKKSQEEQKKGFAF